MCLRDQGIDDNDGVVDIVRRARGLRYDGGGVGREQGIHNTSEGLETTTEVAGARRRSQGVYNDGGGVGGGR